jgi:hypothetical protein
MALFAFGGLEIRADRAGLLANVNPAVGIADQLGKRRAARQHEPNRSHQRALAHAVVASSSVHFRVTPRAHLQRQRQRSDAANVGQFNACQEHLSGIMPELFRALCTGLQARRHFLNICAHVLARLRRAVHRPALFVASDIDIVVGRHVHRHTFVRASPEHFGPFS